MVRKQINKEKQENENLLSPLDLENKEDTVEKNEINNDKYYSKDLVQGDDVQPDTMKEHVTDEGGTIKREDTVDGDTVGSEAGTPGHPGIDEDTG